jgi:lipopolysaccharide transport protein LptA
MKTVVWMLVCLAMIGPAIAQEAQKTVITADELEYRYGQREANFKGNVLVQDPEVTMQADTLSVTLLEDNSVNDVVAVGHVVVVQAGRRATCEKAHYSARTGVIVMSGKARLARGKDVVTGDQITIDTNSQRVKCRPGSMTFFSAERSGISGAVKVP